MKRVAFIMAFAVLVAVLAFGLAAVDKPTTLCKDDVVMVKIVKIYEHDSTHEFTSPFTYTTLERMDNHERFIVDGSGLGVVGDQFGYDTKRIP